MLDLTAAREGIKRHLTTVNGGELNVYSHGTTQPEFPAVLIGLPSQVTYNRSVNGLLSEVILPATLMVSAADLPQAVTRMDEHLGQAHARAIQPALVADDGRGDWSSLRVISAGPVEVIGEDESVLSVDFQLEVQG